MKNKYINKQYNKFEKTVASELNVKRENVQKAVVMGSFIGLVLFVTLVVAIYRRATNFSLKKKVREKFGAMSNFSITKKEVRFTPGDIMNEQKHDNFRELMRIEKGLELSSPNIRKRLLF